MSHASSFNLGGISIGGGPLFLIAGPCVIESEQHARRMADAIQEIAADLKIPYIFKASYDKANRTSIHSFRGPGLAEGARILRLIGESDRYHHKPLYAEIVHRAHQRGLAGASVFRGLEGFGASSRIHTSRLLSLSEDLPLAIIIVDTAERTDAFLEEIAELVTGGLIIVDDVHVYRYVGGSQQ